MADDDGPWHRAWPSNDLAAGAIADLTIGDVDLVVWRASDGSVCAMDARCPHQWSHLAAEGVVAGDEIVCLSHLWRFEQSGAGWKESVRGRRDRKGDIEVHPCREADGTIWVRLSEDDD